VSEWSSYRRKAVYSPRNRGALVRSPRRAQRRRAPRPGIPPEAKRFLIILALALLAAWWLFASGSFRVTEVRVEGLSQNRSAEITEEVADVVGHSRLLGLRRDSIWLWPTHGVEDRLRDQFPALKELKIERKVPHTVRISAREEPAGLIWQSGDAAYLVSGGGEAIQLVPRRAETSGLPRVRDVAAVPVKTGGKVAPPEFVSFTREVWKGFKGATGSEISELQITETTLEERALSKDGFYVLFDTTRDAARQLGMLKEVAARVKKENKQLEYVDLRVDGRIFYKTK
jgi:hypothetical protein